MKKALILSSLVSTIVLANSQCTEEQIARMIKQNLSNETINQICQIQKVDSSKKELEVNDKQVIVNINNTNNGITGSNIQTDLNNTKQKAPTTSKEYFLWRLGTGYFSYEDYSNIEGTIGLQYFANGVGESGIGLGYSKSFTYSDSEYKNDSTYDSSYYDSNEFELMYNIKAGDNYNIIPTLIWGELNHRVYNTTTTINRFTKTTKTTDTLTSNEMKGLGVYINFPSVAKEGVGLSLYVKAYEIEEETLAKGGIQLVW